MIKLTTIVSATLLMASASQDALSQTEINQQLYDMMTSHIINTNEALDHDIYQITVGLDSLHALNNGDSFRVQHGGISYQDSSGTIRHYEIHEARKGVRLFIDNIASGDGGWELDLTAEKRILGIPTRHKVKKKQYINYNELITMLESLEMAQEYSRPTHDSQGKKQKSILVLRLVGEL